MCSRPRRSSRDFRRWTVAFAAGQIAGPSLFGWLADGLGLESTVLLSAGVLLVGGVAATKRTLVNRCLGLRPETADLLSLSGEPDRLLLAAVKTSLRDLARRWKALDEEIKSLNRQIAAIVTATAPELVDLVLRLVGVTALVVAHLELHPAPRSAAMVELHLERSLERRQ